MATEGGSKKSSSSKKSATKRSASKRTGVKKSAAKASEAANAKSGQDAKLTTAKRVKAAGSATQERQRLKIETERAQYEAKIEANEARLHANTTNNGKPLTPEQISTTQEIIKAQREHLAELESYSRAKLEDDPRLSSAS